MVETLLLADRFLMAHLLSKCKGMIMERLDSTNAARVATRVGLIERAKELQENSSSIQFICSAITLNYSCRRDAGNLAKARRKEAKTRNSNSTFHIK